MYVVFVCVYTKTSPFWECVIPLPCKTSQTFLSFLQWNSRQLMNINRLISLPRRDMFGTSSIFPEEGVVSLYRCGCDLLLVHVWIKHPFMLRWWTPHCPPTPQCVEYKCHMPPDMFGCHGAVVMATPRGHRVCAYGKCVRDGQGTGAY